MVNAVQSQRKRIFTVEADAIVRIPPDRVVISAGVRTTGKALGEVRHKNRIILGNAIETAQRCGVAARNISVSHLRIEPRFDGETERIERYCVDQRLTVILDDISTYEELLSRLIDTGINEIHNVEFQAVELKKYRNNARVAAITAAVEKANFLTQAAGLKLGRIVNLSERTSWYSPFGKPNDRVDQTTQPASQALCGFCGSDESGNDGVLGLGTISIQAFVTVHFELADPASQRTEMRHSETQILEDLANLTLDHSVVSASVLR
ncbi:MAG: SIMPL domain-containing protein [Acidobacteriota bacterium]|nr:SIMPL domain-containing protein [Acidobacteriota bacterium]